MRARHLWAGVALALTTATGIAQTPLPDRLGHVSDLAGVMSAEAAGQLDRVLSGYAAATGIRIAVLTLENPVEESPEALAGRALAIFQQGDATQRAAILVWTQNGHIVIYIGTGLRAAITDPEAQAIIDDTIVPASAAGDVDNALMLGAYRLIESAMGPDATTEEPPTGPVPSLPHGAPPITNPEHAAAALGRDLRLLAGAFVGDPPEAASRFSANVQAQARALPATVAGQVPLILSDADSIVFLCIAAAVLVVVLTAIARATRSPPVTVCALVMAAAVAIWLPTGFTELSLLVLLAGQLGLIGWLMWGRRMTAALAGSAAARPAAPDNAYAAWLARQQARQAVLRPSAQRMQARPAAAVVSRPASTPAGGAKPPSPALRRTSEMLERAHAAGIATPAMDRIAARWRTITSAAYKPQRVGMLVTLVVLALLFLPLAFLVVVAWIFLELHALKQPTQKLAEFFQQLSREVQALQRFQ